MPILGAKVEVTVTKSERDGTVVQKWKMDLLDSGSGDPDITKGDGVYTRYFSADEWGAGVYTFEVMVTDNGNTAYSWSEQQQSDGEILFFTLSYKNYFYDQLIKNY